MDSMWIDRSLTVVHSATRFQMPLDIHGYITHGWINLLGGNIVVGLRMLLTHMLAVLPTKNRVYVPCHLQVPRVKHSAHSKLQYTW